MFRRRKQLREQAREEVRAARRDERARPKPKKLSEEIAALAERFAAGPLTLGDVVGILQGRAWTLVLILLSLPFITPIPLPFLSTPFGLAIALISLRLALGQRPWLPASLLAKPLPPGFFGSVLKFAGRVLRVLEKLLRPRAVWFTESVWLARGHAVLMLVAALVLLLPLPVPFSNSFPAWTVLLVAGGLLERDGVAILAGYAVAAAGAAFFYFLGEGAVRLVEALRAWVLGG
ncbi:MAG: exopolysaccharide biosynthesis protein [Verrucomicrobia bacterium]|nr:exopolysaccharide biosynthesis protein [Verrucomicrobiota bacterium]